MASASCSTWTALRKPHLAPLHLGKLHPGGGVAGQPPAVHRGIEDLGEDLMGLARALGRQAAADQASQPLAHRKRVDVRQPRPGERGEDLLSSRTR